MELISKSDLARILFDSRKQTMISMVCATAPAMRAASADGTPNPYRIGKGRNAVVTLTKVTKVNGTIGGDFGKIVVNRAKAEIIDERLRLGSDPLSAEALEAEAQDRYRRGSSWHCPILHDDGEPSCLSIHTDADDTDDPYVRFIFRSKGEAEYFDETASKVSEIDVVPFLAALSDRKNQDIEHKVIVVTYALASVVEIAINGSRYRISDTLADMSEGVRAATLKVADEYLTASRRLSVV